MGGYPPPPTPPEQIKLENHDGVYSYTIVDLVQKPVGGIHDE